MGIISSQTSDADHLVAASTNNAPSYFGYNNVLFMNSSTIPDSREKFNQYFQFLEIPLIMRLRIIERKIRINLLGGLNTDVLIGNRVVLVNDSRKSVFGETEGIRTINYAGNAGFGFEYDITRKLLFTFEPQFKYYLNSINTEVPINNRPYSIGMFTGVKTSITSSSISAVFSLEKILSKSILFSSSNISFSFVTGMFSSLHLFNTALTVLPISLAYSKTLIILFTSPCFIDY
jgi:hypothetical protein